MHTGEDVLFILLIENIRKKHSASIKIKKKYEKFRLDVAFKSEKKRIGILGASGCGKSLTL